MIKARHNPFYVFFFRWYSRHMLKKHFYKLICHEVPEVSSNPVLLISNHFSWWDGFFAEYLNSRYFKKKLHIMMLEEQLKTRMFLNKAGAFSIKKGTKEIYDTFEYCANLFNNPDNLLVMYPQGGFQSVHSFPVTFNRGVIKITEKIDQDFQLIFLAVLTDFFAHKKPSVNFFLQEYNLKYKHSIEQLEQAYNDFLKESILAQNENIFN